MHAEDGVNDAVVVAITALELAMGHHRWKPLEHRGDCGLVGRAGCGTATKLDVGCAYHLRVESSAWLIRIVVE